MRCPVCGREMAEASLTGSLSRTSCLPCNLHIVEQIADQVDMQDFINILRQVAYKVKLKGE